VTFGRLPFAPAFAFACALLFMACTRSALRPAATPAPQQLPRGGTRVFPHFRVVAFYGYAGVPGLGVLGQGAPSAAGAKLLTQAHAYAPFGRPILPAFELIATKSPQTIEHGARPARRPRWFSHARWLTSPPLVPKSAITLVPGLAPAGRR
jgi:hypothetical protein